MFYGGDIKLSYTACQWIEAQAIEKVKHIHHKMCGHGGERMMIVWVLNDKDENESFLVDRYEPETNTEYQFHGCHWHGHTCLNNRTKRQQRDMKIRVGLIGLSKIMNGIQSIIICQPGNVKNQY